MSVRDMSIIANMTVKEYNEKLKILPFLHNIEKEGIRI